MAFCSLHYVMTNKQNTSNSQSYSYLNLWLSHYRNYFTLGFILSDTYIIFCNLLVLTKHTFLIYQINIKINMVLTFCVGNEWFLFSLYFLFLFFFRLDPESFRLNVDWWEKTECACADNQHVYNCQGSVGIHSWHTWFV